MILLLAFPFLLLSGLLMRWLALFWVRRRTGLPTGLRWPSALLLYWMLLSHGLVLAGIERILAPHDVAAGLMLGAGCYLLMMLDVTGFWMPLPFTAATGACGLLFSVFIVPVRSVPAIAAEASITFLTLWLLRWLTGRYEESLGMGDVCLITALVMWFPLSMVIWAFALALMPALVFALIHRHRLMPFGLFLCPAASLLPFISALMQGWPEGHLL